ncbi:hypothetical protein [Pedobacter sp.]
MEAILEVLFALFTGAPGRATLKKMKPIAIAYSFLGIFVVTWLAVDKYLL